LIPPNSFFVSHPMGENDSHAGCVSMQKWFNTQMLMSNANDRTMLCSIDIRDRFPLWSQSQKKSAGLISDSTIHMSVDAILKNSQINYLKWHVFII
jgi:hypothetical protein